MNEMGKGTTAALAEIAKLGRGMSLGEVAEIASAVQKVGGNLVGFEPDGGERCGNGRVIIKWPPRGDIQHVIDALVSRRINFEVLINGIPVPDELAIRFSRSITSI